MVYDKGITGEKSSDWTTTNVTVTTTATETTLSTLTGAYTSTKALTGDFELLVELQSEGNCRFGVQTSGATKSALCYGGHSSWNYVKITRNSGVIKFYVSSNGTNWIEWNGDSGNNVTTEDCYFTLRLLVDDRTISYKNLKAYSI